MGFAWHLTDGSGSNPSPPEVSVPASVQQVALNVSCHAWNGDLSMCALSPNNSEVHIYKVSNEKWDKVAVLKEHSQLVSSLAWAPKSNKLLSVSHDRNGFVFQTDGDKWEPVLVVLRLNRAALCAQWTPSETKFAIGSGAKTVCVCYYEQENNWWVSKHIKKKHGSSVLSVAWHPNNIFLATCSSDNKCHIYSAFISGVDEEAGVSDVLEGAEPFGALLQQIDVAGGWARSVAWSPSGSSLAFVSHDSSIHFTSGITSTASSCRQPMTTIRFASMPFYSLIFLSETQLIAAGYDCIPVLFEKDSNSGFFLPVKSLVCAAEGPKRASQFNAAFDLFRDKTEKGQTASDSALVGGSQAPVGPHQNLITCIQPMGKGKFSTAGMDGKIVCWSI
mmetsp:Transcript_25687/g.43020  ORF Transcript_25687/g.43020 Transcript_25687/m.43020 type:complete len:390 (-) Transcript_25687:300-1469(-)